MLLTYVELLVADAKHDVARFISEIPTIVAHTLSE